MAQWARHVFVLAAVAVLALAGCRKPDGAPAPQPPHPRIVSFSPALTDLLYQMNLGSHVVGVTSYCIPPAGERPPVVGDRSRVSAEAILAVKPDLVLIQQNPADFGAVRSIDPRVRIEAFTIETLADVAAAIGRIGALTGTQDQAAAAGKAFEEKLSAVRRSVEKADRPKVLLLIDYDRPSTGGAGTFIDEMIQLAGGSNAAADRGYSGWKNLNRENIQAMAPDVLICLTSAGQEQAALEHWRSFSDSPAVKANRVYVLTDRRWTIPSIRSADFAAELAGMIQDWGLVGVRGKPIAARRSSVV